MEGAIIAALAEEGVGARSRRDEGIDYTGVWVQERKIASIGVHVSRGVTTHGFAVNVENDLEPFSWVVACGLPDVAMTSLARELAPGALDGPGVVCASAWRTTSVTPTALASASSRRGASGSTPRTPQGEHGPGVSDGVNPVATRSRAQPGRHGRAARARRRTCGRCASASRRGSRCRRPAASATAS